VGHTTPDPEATEHWRALLTGEDRSLQQLRRVWKHLPASPRCKVCAAPFHGPGRLATRLAMHGQSPQNPLLCGMCFRQLGKHPGGAEIEIGVLFADVRGSTAIAERLTPHEFREHLQRYYELGGRAIERNGGIVDKFLGDGIMALFIPVIAGEGHARRAVLAGADLLRDVEASELPDLGIRAGVGIEVGNAFVGVLGADERLDFSALGDSVNTAARLGAAAGPGRLLVSEGAWSASGFGGSGPAIPRRSLEVAGRHEPVTVLDLASGDLAAIH
jgi:adenylate cyclase